LTAVEVEPPPNEEPREDGIGVFFDPAHYNAADIEAELPNGSRVPAVLQEGGRRLGFDRLLPAGTWILRRGVRTWGPIGRPH
jgi:hypothetical protein